MLLLSCASIVLIQWQIEENTNRTHTYIYMPSIFMLLLSCAFIFHVSLAHSWSTLLLNAELVSNYIHEEHSYIMCQLILADTTVDV